MAKNDFTNLVNPERRVTVDTKTQPLEWRVQRLGFDVLSDANKQTLDNISAQLEDVTKILDTISEVAETVLRPVIDILRTIEDPFSSLIEIILSEIEKILQEIEGQGLYILDFITPYIINNSSQTTYLSDFSNAVQKLNKEYNQWILKTRAQSIFDDEVNEKRLAEAGLETDSRTGQIKPSKNSPRRPALTQAELNRAAQKSNDYQLALNWVNNYNEEIISIVNVISSKYDDLERGAKSLAFNPASLEYRYYVGVEYDTRKETKSNTNDNSQDLNKAYFNIPPLSTLIDDTGEKKTKFVTSLLDNGNIISYRDNSSASTINLFSSKLFTTSSTGASIKEVVSTEFKDSQDEAIRTIAEFSEKVVKIDSSNDSFTNKKKRIYKLIEDKLRNTDNTAVINPYIVPSAKRPLINNNIKLNYVDKIKSFLSAPVTEETSSKISSIRSLVKSNIATSQFIKKDSFSAINDVVGTGAGFRLDSFMASKLKDLAVQHKNRETQAFRKVIDFINIEVEYAGRANNLIQPTKNPRRSPVNSRPPILPIGESLDESPSSSSMVKLNNRDLQNTLAVLESVTSELNKLEISVNKLDYIKYYYNKLASNFIDINKTNFILLERTLIDIENGAKKEFISQYGNSPGGLVNNGSKIGINSPPGNELQDNFYRLIEIMINIKKSFYPFILNRNLSNISIDQTTSESGKTSSEVETLYTDMFVSDESYTPYSSTMEYLKKFSEVLSDSKFDPFEIYSDGFEGTTIFENFNNQIFDLNDRIEFLNYMSSIRTQLVSNDVELPTVFFNSSANGVGIPRAVLQILQRINEIDLSKDIKFNNLKNKIVSELSAIDTARRCVEKSSGSEIPDEVKAKLKEQASEVESEIEITKSLIENYRNTLSSKISALFSPNSTTQEKSQLIDEINGTFFSEGLVEKVGGTLYEIDAFGKPQSTSEIVEGSLTNRLVKLNFRLNNLKIDSINRDSDVADEFGDQTLKTKLTTNISVLTQEYDELQARISVSTGDVATQLTERSKRVKSELDASRSYLNQIYGTNLTANQSDFLLQIVDLLNVTQRAIKSTEIIINDIEDDGLPLSENAKDALIGRGDFAPAGKIDMVSHPVLKMNPSVTVDGFTESDLILEKEKDKNQSDEIVGEFNYNISDENDFDRDEIITLFQNAPGPNEEEVIEELNKLKSSYEGSNEELFSNIRLQVDADITRIIDFSSFRDSNTFLATGVSDLRPRLSLRFQQRLEDFLNIRSILRQQMAYGLSNKPHPFERNHAGTGKVERNWLRPVSKNLWIQELMSTLRDQNDLRRPIFPEDISNTKALTQLYGELNGKEAQKNIENSLSFGEMTFVVMAVVSTDAEKTLEDVKNLYSIFVNPSGLRAYVNRFKKQIEEQFGSMISNQLINDIDAFFSPPEEDIIDRLKRSVINEASDGCYDNIVPPNKSTRVDRWMSIQLGDLFILGVFFDFLRELIAKARNSFMPKLGLADLLEDLLDFILDRISILKRIVAGIGLIIELIDFIAQLHFETAVLTVRNVKSVNQLENELRKAINFPKPYNAQSDDDPVYILSICMAMPNWFYESLFGKIIKEIPANAFMTPSFNFGDWSVENPIFSSQESDINDLKVERISDKTKGNDRSFIIQE